jgi:hypothetical protein
MADRLHTSGAELATPKAPKRKKPGKFGYLTTGRSKHALFASAGWNSQAKCGTGPHWSDYVGWRGAETPEEEAEVARRQLCRRCARFTDGTVPPGGRGESVRAGIPDELPG